MWTHVQLWNILLEECYTYLLSPQLKLKKWKGLILIVPFPGWQRKAKLVVWSSSDASLRKERDRASKAIKEPLIWSLKLWFEKNKMKYLAIWWAFEPEGHY